MLEIEISPNPFAMEQEQKEAYMLEKLKFLTEYHKEHCEAFARMLNGMGYDSERIHSVADIPFLPVTLFKMLRLSSLSEEQDYKIVTSSGTSGQVTSQIVLDGETRNLQQQVLASIGSSFLGKKRLPMLVIDCSATVKKRDHFSARTAGIQGFSLFGRYRTFALKDDMTLDREEIDRFLECYGDQPFLIYGFTYIVWKYLVQEIENDDNWSPDLSLGILVHGGGWKKLQDEAVSHDAFHQRLQKSCGITRIMDYYGMAEQSGSIFMECECGHLHCSDYSAIRTRRSCDFSECNIGEKGLIQVMSLVAGSYPGHSLLTEDEGTILGVDDCPCGRKGVYFKVHGRVKQAELRGCSDVLETSLNKTSSDETQDITWIIGDESTLAQMSKQPAESAFSDSAVTFLHALSRRLLHNTEVRSNWPDVLTFAFWCRKAHIAEMQKAYSVENTRIGKGVSLHFASSNIPMMFAYSMAVGLLAGNSCIVRMSRRRSRQDELVVAAIREVLWEDVPEMTGRMILCRYDHDDRINQYLSQMCDVRLMWGSDTSIRKIQAASISADTLDLAFGTRYSACIMDGRKVLEMDETDTLARQFYNDTYLNDQNACASPRIVYWVGTHEDCVAAQKRFWSSVKRVLNEQHYVVQDTLAVQKHACACQICVHYDDVNILSGSQPGETDNRILRIQMNNLDERIWAFTTPGGFFIEAEGKDMQGLALALIPAFQTLTFYGVTVAWINEQLMRLDCTYVRQMAEIGHGLDFCLQWDGHDLIREMTVDVDQV